VAQVRDFVLWVTVFFVQSPSAYYRLRFWIWSFFRQLKFFNFHERSLMWILAVVFELWVLCAVILKLPYRFANLISSRDFVWEIWSLVCLYDSCVFRKQGNWTLAFWSLIAFLMFNIPVGVCFNFDRKISHSQLCLYLFIWRFELQVSACYGHHQAAVKNMNTETLLFRKGEAFRFTVS
jgi:hypothetical protein